MSNQSNSLASTSPGPLIPQRQQHHIRTFADTNYFGLSTYKRALYDAFVTVVPAHLITKTLLAPLERWRIIAQTQMTYPKRPKKFKGFADYLSRSTREQGWSSHWRGNQANCWLQVAQTILQVGLYDNFKVVLQEYEHEYVAQPIIKGFIDRIVGPICVSMASLLILYPIDTARIRLTMNFYPNPRQALFKGIPSALSLISLEEGSYRKAYKGYLLANLIAVAHLNLFLSVRSLGNALNSNNDQYSTAVKQIAASMLAVTLLHPLDTLKKSVQLNNASQPGIFNSVRQCYKYIDQNLSYRALFNGMTISIVRTVLYSACLLAATQTHRLAFNSE